MIIGRLLFFGGLRGRRQSPPEGSVRFRSLHPSQRLLRHRFAITCIRRAPPSNVSEGGHAFLEVTAACRLRSPLITDAIFLMLCAVAKVANSASTSLKTTFVIADLY